MNDGEPELVFEISFMGSQTVTVLSSAGDSTRYCASATVAPSVDLMGVTHGSTTVHCGQFILECYTSSDLKASSIASLYQSPKRVFLPSR